MDPVEDKEYVDDLIAEIERLRARRPHTLVYAEDGGGWYTCLLCGEGSDLPKDLPEWCPASEVPDE